MLALEQLRQLIGVDARNRNVRTDAVDHEGEQQKDEPTTEVAELACFCERCRVSCHEEFLSVRREDQATLPPAASIAALAPAVAPTPVSLTALVSSPVLMILTTLII